MSLRLEDVKDAAEADRRKMNMMNMMNMMIWRSWRIPCIECHVLCLLSNRVLCRASLEVCQHPRGRYYVGHTPHPIGIILVDTLVDIAVEVGRSVIAYWWCI